MIRRFSIYFMVFFVSYNVMGQGINYKIIEDNPYYKDKITFHLDPMHADIWGANLNLALGFRVEYPLMDRMQLDFLIKKAYLDDHASKHDDLSSLFYLEAFANYSLVEMIKTKQRKVVLDVKEVYKGGQEYEQTQFYMAPASVRRTIDARGGLSYVNAAVKVKETGITNNSYAMMKMPSLYAGLSLNYSSLLVTDTEGWGKNTTAVSYSIFFDLMLAPSISFSPVDDAAAFNSLSKSNGGWRVGFKGKPLSFWGFSYQLAVGKRPGFKGPDGADLLDNPRFFFEGILGVSIPYNK